MTTVVMYESHNRNCIEIDYILRTAFSSILLYYLFTYYLSIIILWYPSLTATIDYDSYDGSTMGLLLYGLCYL